MSVGSTTETVVLGSDTLVISPSFTRATCFSNCSFIFSSHFLICCWWNSYVWTACSNINKYSSFQIPANDFKSTSLLAFIRASHNLYNISGSLSPPIIALTISIPVLPKISLISVWTFTFINSKAFCIRLTASELNEVKLRLWRI